MDFMCILKNISFSEEDQTSGNLTLREDTPFVNAYITKEESLKMWEDFLVEDPLEDANKNRLSSKKLKARLYGNYKKGKAFYQVFLMLNREKCKTIADGAALEVSQELLNLNYSNPFGVLLNAVKNISREFIFSSDIVLSIRCDGWPSNAREWIERERVWPDKDLVQKICENGFHIVPKSSLEGDFRLSFSKAEATLIEHLTPLQHKVLRSFKAVVKYHQSNWSPNIKDMICTYHLKTIAFWHFEKSAQDSWTEDNVVSHLLSLLDEFAQALRDGNLPMYFLPKYNLFGKVEDPDEMKWISDKVTELSIDIPALAMAVNEITNLNFLDKIFVEPKKHGENGMEVGRNDCREFQKDIEVHEKASTVSEERQQVMKDKNAVSLVQDDSNGRKFGKRVLEDILTKAENSKLEGFEVLAEFMKNVDEIVNPLIDVDLGTADEDNESETFD